MESTIANRIVTSVLSPRDYAAGGGVCHACGRFKRFAAWVIVDQESTQIARNEDKPQITLKAILWRFAQSVHHLSEAP
jgi:hypothetical protein